MPSLDKVKLTDISYPVFKVEALVNFMHDEGASVEALLAGSQIKQSELNSPEKLISIDQLIQIFDNCQQLSNDPFLALRAGQQMHVSNYGIYGFAMLSSHTLGEAVSFAIKYHALATPTVQLELIRKGKTARFIFQNRLPVESLERFNMEFQLALVYSLFKDLAQPGFTLDEVLVDYEEPKIGQHYETFLESPVHFNQQSTEFRFCATLLDCPLPSGNKISHKMMLQLCESAMAEIENNDGIVSQVRSMMLSQPMYTDSAENLAARLNMTSRTLRRKLSSQNTNYRKLRKATIESLAKKYLSTSMTIEEIASRLGYSDATSFSHAFKRWTKLAPNQYRRELESPNMLKK